MMQMDSPKDGDRDTKSSSSSEIPVLKKMGAEAVEFACHSPEGEGREISRALFSQRATASSNLIMSRGANAQLPQPTTLTRAEIGRISGFSELSDSTAKLVVSSLSSEADITTSLREIHAELAKEESITNAIVMNAAYATGATVVAAATVCAIAPKAFFGSDGRTVAADSFLMGVSTVVIAGSIVTFIGVLRQFYQSRDLSNLEKMLNKSED